MGKGEFEARASVKPADSVELPKKKNTGLSMLCVLLAVGLIGAVAYIAAEKLGYIGDGKIANDKQSTEKCLVTQEQVDNPEEGSIAEIVATADDELTIRNVLDEIYHGSFDYVSSAKKVYDTSISGSYPVVDYGDYKAAIRKTFGLELDDYKDLGAAAGSTTWDFLRNDINSILKDNGFEEKEFSALGYAEGYKAKYESGDIVCVYDNRPDYGTDVTCASKSWMTADEELYSGLYKAFEQSSDWDNKTGVTFNAGRIKEGKDGYESIDVSIGAGLGGANGMFYRKAGEDWKLFKTVQNILYCSAYDTDELKAAFAYNNCVDDDTHAIRKVNK